MSTGVAVLAIVLSGAAAAIFAALVQRLVSNAWRRKHHDVGSVVFLQIGVVFAVLLAFVANECLTEYNAAQRAIDGECSALHGAAILASSLPAPAAHDVLTLERAYVAAVIGQEWPAMRRNREGSGEARLALTKLVQRTAQLRPADAGAQGLQGQVLALLAEAHAQRETRIYEAGSGIPLALWAVLIGFTALLAAFVAFAGVEGRTTAAVVAFLFAASTVSILTVTALLNYPFEGALALTPADFQHTLGNIDALMPRG